ncbi:MAG: Smr/MutS family protein [Clostridia bacterium]|nr:Smr/MutS family protein [Clostridia bacterium]
MKKSDLPTPGILELDIHGMTKMQAKTLIGSRLKAIPKSAYRLRIIHGYHGGTELREMVRKDFRTNPKVLRVEVGLNPGETDLVLRELF